MSLLAGLSFGTPWILAALIALPAIWWLLRITPPAPRRIIFPPLRLLMGLPDEEQTPSHTPWWVLLLRLLAAALLIFALAEPLIGQAPKLSGDGPLVLFVDNGWTAAQNWEARDNLIADLLRSAAHDRRSVAIIATADAPNADLLDAGKASRIARELKPEPWLGDRAAAVAALAKQKFSVTPQIVWLSDGIEDGTSRLAAEKLSRIGALKIYGDAPGKMPLALLPAANDANGFAATVIRADATGERNGDVAAMGARGETLALAHLHFADGGNRATAHINLPLEVRNETARLAIANLDSAGAVQLLDSGTARQSVGLVSASAGEAEQPLLSDIYYLERALGPYADIRKGTISDLIDKHVSVLVLADIGKVAGADADRVTKFVADGGLLIRFAGERMAADVDDLVPVKLRIGGRYLGGALAWASPQHLAPFSETSPFNGLPIPPDVTVSRQILAEPSVELSDHSWARLADGTPLVTAQQRGRGWIVLFHITASPTWSSLPLSGLYVDMLRRTIALSAGARASDLAGMTSLPPVETMDGFGRMHPAPADALPVRASEIAKTAPSRIHPPGLYGAHGVETALNAVSNSTVLLPMAPLGQEPYGETHTIALQPALLAAALLLLIFDTLLSFWLRGHIPLPRQFIARGAGLLLAALLFQAHPARADDAFALKAANDTRLAYVATGLPDVDAMSKAGLDGLNMALRNRTSYEPQDPMGVNVETDDLSFFPLLYWPMDPREHDLSPAALSKIGNYMRSGGTILFDTRDLTLGAVRGEQSPGEQTLRRLIAKLDLPPLEPVPSDHVLTKAFYILRDFPGRWDGGKLWVEALPPADPGKARAPARGGDGVSPILIGSNDWAAAWAVDANGRPLVEPVPGGETQREMALRFGVNLVMYALTGNYKTDQVHAPALLERLGK